MHVHTCSNAPRTHARTGTWLHTLRTQAHTQTHNSTFAQMCVNTWQEHMHRYTQRWSILYGVVRGTQSLRIFAHTHTHTRPNLPRKSCNLSEIRRLDGTQSLPPNTDFPTILLRAGVQRGWSRSLLSGLGSEMLSGQQDGMSPNCRDEVGEQAFHELPISPRRGF